MMDCYIQSKTLNGVKFPTKETNTLKKNANKFQGNLDLGCELHHRE